MNHFKVHTPVRLKPPRSQSWQPRRSLAITTKKEQKQNDNQHEDHNQKGRKQL